MLEIRKRELFVPPRYDVVDVDTGETIGIFEDEQYAAALVRSHERRAEAAFEKVLRAVWDGVENKEFLHGFIDKGHDRGNLAVYLPPTVWREIRKLIGEEPDDV
jgi:hypothetical protein